MKLSALRPGKPSVQMALSFSNQIAVKGKENEKKEGKQRITKKSDTCERRLSRNSFSSKKYGTIRLNVSSLGLIRFSHVSEKRET